MKRVHPVYAFRHKKAVVSLKQRQIFTHRYGFFMEESKFITRIDVSGRIPVSKEYRDALSWHEGDLLEAFLCDESGNGDPDSIFLKKIDRNTSLTYIEAIEHLISLMGNDKVDYSKAISKLNEAKQAI